MNTILLPGKLFLMESNFADNFWLNNCDAWLKFSAHSLAFPPAKVLCAGKHPIGGAPKTATLRAPNS